MDDCDFYLVWRDGGGVPTHKHGDLDAARAEAARLARNHPDSKFVVLGSICAAVKTDVVFEDMAHAQIPF